MRIRGLDTDMQTAPKSSRVPPKGPFKVQKGSGTQTRIWEKGCLSSSSALGRCLASTKMQRMKSRACSEVCEGSSGLVGWVAILKMAAMASYSAHGGFSVSISTTVHPRLLGKRRRVDFNLGSVWQRGQNKAETKRFCVAKR